MDGSQARGRAERATRGRDQELVRRFREVQGAVRGRRYWALRLRVGVAHRRGEWQAYYHEHAEPGQPADGREEGDSRARSLGACVLPQVPESSAGLYRSVVERRELGCGGEEALGLRGEGAGARSAGRKRGAADDTDTR